LGCLFSVFTQLCRFLGASEKSECTIFTGYTSGVICRFISDCNCECRTNLEIIESWVQKPIEIWIFIEDNNQKENKILFLKNKHISLRINYFVFFCDFCGEVFLALIFHNKPGIILKVCCHRLHISLKTNAFVLFCFCGEVFLVSIFHNKQGIFINIFCICMLISSRIYPFVFWCDFCGEVFLALIFRDK